MQNSLDFTLIDIPSSKVQVGRTSGEIDASVEFWQKRVIKPEFSALLKGWFYKEYPKHWVDVKAFRIMKYPVTERLYFKYISECQPLFAEQFKEYSNSKLPVSDLDQEQVSGFIGWTSSHFNLEFRLPSETEWEYMARGNSSLEYPYGQHFNPTRGNTKESGVGAKTPVDRYEKFPSPLGVIDMAGNVEEVTSSTYKVYPGGELVRDHLYDINSGAYPILRGGSWTLGGDLSRCSRRHGPGPQKKLEYRCIGLRLATRAK